MIREIAQEVIKEDIIKLLVGDDETFANASLVELCEKGYIVLGVNEESVQVKEGMSCRIFFDEAEDGDTIEIFVLCSHEFWLLDDMRQRPMEIITKINSYIENIEFEKSVKINHFSTNILPIGEDWAVAKLSLIKNSDISSHMSDNLLHYKEILDIIINKLISNIEVKQLLAVDDAHDIKEMNYSALLEKGYIRLSPNLSINEASQVKNFILIHMEDEVSLADNVDTNIYIYVVGDRGNILLENGDNRLEKLGDIVKETMYTFNGINVIDRDNIELDEDISACSLVFEMNSTLETIEDERIEEDDEDKNVDNADDEDINNLPAH